jgi:hypothetical protein
VKRSLKGNSRKNIHCCGAVVPEIQLRNRRIDQLRARETILECIITAYPLAVNYWEKDGRRITSSSKYRLEAFDEGDNTLVLSLRIRNLEPADYGEYKCVAANALGRDEESMILYGEIFKMPVKCVLIFTDRNVQNLTPRWCMK